jgi:uncharacterized protein (TIGR03437 family)
MINNSWKTAWRKRIQPMYRRNRQFGRQISMLVLAAATIAFTSCGGGSGGSTAPPQSPTITSVAASCTPASVQVGETSQCSATVSGTGNYSSGVSWSAVSGTVSSAGVYTAPATMPAAGSDVVTAKSTEDSTKSGMFTITVQSKPNTQLGITTTSVPNATGGMPYSTTLAASGGSGTGYTWALTAASMNSLPTGFSLSTGGVLGSSGSPDATAGAYPFPVQVTDSASNISAKSFTLTVQARSSAGLALQIVTPTLPSATTGKFYSVTLAAEGGSGTGYTWTAPGFFSPLPSGFSLSAGGVLTSTSVSAAANTYVIPVQVTDSAGNTATSPFALIVQPATPVLMNSIVTDLHDFGESVIVANGASGLDGSYVLAGVTFDTAGNMYGTANGGGGNAAYGSYDPNLGVDVVAGMVWELEPSGIYKDLHDFGGCTAYPCAETVTNANGTPGPDGWGPDAGVTRDDVGDIYGTTSQGGPYGGGTKGPFPGDGIVWEIMASGTYKDLHDFGGTVINAGGASGPDGVNSKAGVTLDSDGNLYGTASGGGANNAGIVWEIASSGTYMDLHDFGGTVTNAGGTSGADGSTPSAGVTFDSAGDKYGTTTKGGAHNQGLVWEITASGSYRDLHDFGGTVTTAGGASGTDGEEPFAGVTFDATGNMYGTTGGGGANKGGIVWEIESTGAYKDLHDFGGTVVDANGASGPDGIEPYMASVSLDGSGNLYGTTLVGGQYTGYALPNNTVSAGGGTVWEITASGTYKDLYDFVDGGVGQWGFWPAAGVTLDKSGSIYGTTSGAYDNDAPVDTMLWKLTPASTTLPGPVIAPGGIIPVGSGSAVGASISPNQTTGTPLTSGEWLSIYGSNLASSTVNWIGKSPDLANGSLSWTGDFPTSLGGTSVTINGVGAYLSFVSPSQIILQVPNDIDSTSTCCANQATGPVSLVVTTTSGTATSAVTLTTFGAPSFLLLDDTHVAGIILRSDGSGAYGNGTYDIIGPTGNSLGYPTVAAKAGDSIVLFAVGMAPTTAGQAWEGSALLDGNGADVLINNVEVLSGATPQAQNGLALTGSGLFQISLTLPSGLGTGDVPIVAAVGVMNEGAVLTSPTVLISLQ